MARTPKNLKDPDLRLMCRFMIRLQKEHQQFLGVNFESMMNALFHELRELHGLEGLQEVKPLQSLKSTDNEKVN